MSYRYHIHKYNTDNLSAVIFSTNVDSPMNYLGSVEEELHKNGVKGNVLFDLLLSTGNTSERYYSAFFDGDKLVENSIKKFKNPSKDILKESLLFYHQKSHFLKNSVLNKAQKYLIKNNHLLISRSE
ncbi:type II toxin-antitoxin system RnlB family antitoxin [Desulforhopalus sp. 52FAK]